ncbi:GLPGLI family protein [Spirosoma sp. KUDC1026]|uniref:GLPGLI family protein n=1 Tax=Spirosoma sp. KUDC1026 TaxID=2745947 RepID=UPI00159B9ABD|nr:GLPGLI family protein [Spirosoma sp. KUDC1026]QKZ11288.1 GLPGLI family protein [Spirosoma sp. KUDC1026]
MKTSLLILLAALASCLPALAQSGYQISYTLGGELTGRGVLRCYPTQSVYEEKSGSAGSPEAKSYPNETIAKAMKNVNKDQPVAMNSQFLFKRDLTNQTLLYAESETPYGYTVQDNTLPEWTILNETRKLGNYTCQKAKTLFRGREYVAWFTRQIPIESGPWKLAGLPGLILEATSADQQYQFLFAGMQTTTQPIHVSFHKSVLTFPQYVQKVNQYYQERANKIYAEVSSGFLQRFGVVKTSPVSMNVDNIEKDLAKRYVSTATN